MARIALNINETEDKVMARFLKYSLLLAVLSALAPDISVSAENPKIITFDAPGAGTVAGQVPLPQGTFPYGISDSGAIGGNFQDGNNVLHGLLRTPDGAFIAFDAPGAGTGPFQGTQGFVINSEGAIAGNYLDASNVVHGFLRAPDDHPDDTLDTTIDVPGEGTGAFQGTVVCSVDCLSPEGAVVGFYTDGNNLSHGFLRAPDGAITTFDALGAGGGPGQGTFGGGINAAGLIVGSYLDANNVNHGFLRSRDGTFTAFDVPSAGTGPFQGTIVLTSTINSEGEITGNYLDENNVSHGFVRARDGAITTFDVKTAGTASGLGTTPVSNNVANAITGYYADANGLYHGFLRTGRRCGEDRQENCETD